MNTERAEQFLKTLTALEAKGDVNDYMNLIKVIREAQDVINSVPNAHYYQIQEPQLWVPNGFTPDNVWLETTRTDSWTLQQQNEEGESLKFQIGIYLIEALTNVIEE